MDLLSPYRFDLQKAAEETTKLGEYLNRHEYFSERDVVALLKTLPNLTVLMGSLGSRMIIADSFKYEFTIQGAVAADLILRNASKNTAVFVEFEGGESTSVFARKGTNQLNDWSRQIEHATGQIIDWAWAMSDATNSVLFETNIGMRTFAAQFLIVCGREKSLDTPGKRTRLEFRRKAISVSNYLVTFLTYDELHRELDYALSTIRSGQA
jgi:Domain of unknown function (DUF4263)